MSSAEKTERRNAIPIIYTSGTYYDVGFDVGRTFRALIQDYLRSFSWLHETLLPAYESEAGRSVYEETLASVQEDYPQYVRELQGIADGAQVPFLHLMLIHMDRTISEASKEGQKACNSGQNGCSSLSINGEDQVLLGHTEDALKDTLNNVYIVSATISEEEPQGKLGTQKENFTAFCYAGDLPGFCSGYNSHGLVFSVNVIRPRRVLSGKTPRHFLCRALLSATSTEAAHGILKDTGAGAADGFSVNMVFMSQTGDHVFQIVEVGPPADGNESLLSSVTLTPGQHYFHANKYLLLDIPETDDAITSSDHRHARFNQFPVPKNRHDLLEILSDTKNNLFPIFREEGSVIGDVRTVSLGVFDLIKKTWTTWMKNPQKADPVMEIPFHFNWNT